MCSPCTCATWRTPSLMPQRFGFEERRAASSATDKESERFGCRLQPQVFALIFLGSYFSKWPLCVVLKYLDQALPNHIFTMSTPLNVLSFCYVVGWLNIVPNKVAGEGVYHCLVAVCVSRLTLPSCIWAGGVTPLTQCCIKSQQAHSDPSDLCGSQAC